jgi:plastocyanin
MHHRSLLFLTLVLTIGLGLGVYLGLAAPARVVAMDQPAHATAFNPAGTVDVRIEDFAFAPAHIRVPVGTTVHWQNFGAFTHTVTSDASAGELDSGALSSTQTFQHQFTKAGIYSYHCNFHPSMTGKVTVVEQVFLPLIIR